MIVIFRFKLMSLDSWDLLWSNLMGFEDLMGCCLIFYDVMGFNVIFMGISWVIK